MSAAREEMLERIRAAGGDGAAGAGEVGAPAAPRPGSPRRFRERVEDYKALVRSCAAAKLESALGAACAEQGVRRAAVPARFPHRAAGVELVPDEPLATDRLDEIGCAIVTARWGIAETGTLVLVADETGGRRALSLIPDRLVVLLDPAAVVADVDDAFLALADELGDGKPVTLVSGPSATSDIELRRVEGVHGPRRLTVVLVDGLV